MRILGGLVLALAVIACGRGTKPEEETGMVTPGLPYTGTPPGAARASAQDGKLVLENDVLRVEWSTADGALRPVAVTDLVAGTTLPLSGEPFEILLGGDERAAAKDLVPGEAKIVPVEPGPGPRASDACRGVAIEVPFGSP
ncbi:MAG: hypothetical protein ABFS86_20735, partial [Planctomycetota bacterium]